jgi:uncharacterized membrane-anchored protein YhcB (DUF1043 family)
MGFQFWTGLAAGMIIGAFIGLIIMALLIQAKEENEREGVE